MVGDVVRWRLTFHPQVIREGPSPLCLCVRESTVRYVSGTKNV